MQSKFKFDEKTKIAVELFVLSFVSLYLELLAIRWLSSDIRAFSIFKSFPLVTFFVGLGYGFGLPKERFRWAPIALLALVVQMKLVEVLGLSHLMFPSNSNYNWQQVDSGSPWLYLTFAFFVLGIMLTTLFFLAAFIGARIGHLFDSLQALPAYTINVGGALIGSILFAVSSALALPPAYLLSVPAIALIVYNGLGKTRWLAGLVGAATMLLAFFGAATTEGTTTYWSPYQRLDLVKSTVQALAEDGTKKSIDVYHLNANHVAYQTAHGITKDQFEKWDVPIETKEDIWRWSMPYKIKSGGKVLIVGAGMGSDVAQALAVGADAIDAVDIDPVIISLGRAKHPLKPYDSDKVRIVCDDARHFFNQSKSKYDLVVFSHLDSHTVTGVSSVRLDNYIYTKESIRKAASLLKPDSLMVLTFCSRKDWFASRIYKTVENALGYPPMAFNDKRDSHNQNTIFVVGEPIRSGTFKLPAEVEKNAEHFIPSSSVAVKTLSDDWPYLYLAPDKFDWPYLIAVLLITTFAALAGRKLLFSPSPRVNWQLFFMGAAFMLLELQFISRLALIFGSTWVTTAIVIDGILIMVLIANAIVLKFRDKLVGLQTPLFLMLVASLLCNYFLPVGPILDASELGYAFITILTFSPIVFSSMIFALAFSSVASPSKALAFNLFGSVLGALFEYLTNYIGINSLLLVAVGFYLIALCFSLRPAASPDLSPALSTDG